MGGRRSADPEILGNGQRPRGRRPFLSTGGTENLRNFPQLAPIFGDFGEFFHMRGANWPCAALIEQLLCSANTHCGSPTRTSRPRVPPRAAPPGPGWLGHERVAPKQPEIVRSRWPRQTQDLQAITPAAAKDSGLATVYYQRTVRTYRFDLSQCGTDMPLRDFGATARITTDLVCAALLRRMPSPQI